MTSRQEVFTENVIDQVAATLRVEDPRKRALLARELSRVPELAYLVRTLKWPAPPSATASEFNSLVSACDRILNFLSHGADEDVPHHELSAAAVAYRLLRWQIALEIEPQHPERAIQEGTANAAIRRHGAAVNTVRGAALLAQRGVKATVAPGRGGRRHTRDVALGTTVDHLLDIYERVSGRQPATTIGGPTMRFLEICLPLLGWNLTDYSIRERIRESLGDRRGGRNSK